MTHHIKNVKLSWKPDPLDSRDRVMSFKATNLSALPQRVDLRPSCSLVENQATLGSCTANAVAGALEYLELIDGDETNNDRNLSRLFIYYNMREIQGTLEEDSGGTLRDTIKALSEKGACDELLWPYDIEKFKVKPDQSCYEDGERHKISDYQRLESFSDCLACLAAGYPFVFGFMVYDSCLGPEVAKTGVLNMPGPTEVFTGGHAVCAVGYDMETKTVLVRNSWGTEWGMGGYFTMPFAYVANPNLAQDFWTIRR